MPQLAVGCLMPTPRKERPASARMKLATASWGNLLQQAPDYYTVQPWLMVWPGLAVLITTLSFNLLGDGLRDAFDPRATH